MYVEGVCFDDNTGKDKLIDSYLTVNFSRMDISNTTWSPSAVEGQIAIYLPTAYLRRINLIAFFTSIPRPCSDICQTTTFEHSQGSFDGERIRFSEHTESYKALDLLSLMDTAFITLLKERLEPISPCIFRLGYLKVGYKVSEFVTLYGCTNIFKSLWNSGQQISSISSTINHVQKITMNTSLEKSIASLVWFTYPIVSNFY